MSSVPVSVLDLATVTAGSSTSDAVQSSLEMARAADRLGAHR